jgi:hypothetical protein
MSSSAIGTRESPKARGCSRTSTSPASNTSPSSARSRSLKCMAPPVWQACAAHQRSHSRSMAALMRSLTTPRVVCTCACMPMPEPITLFTTIARARLA